jgi:GH24 family phage-related lysozyme (muramidase)
MNTTLRSKKVAAAAALATIIAVPAEGLRQYAYYDPPGILTVCRGHTGPDVVKGKKYSIAECDQFMTDDMRKAVIQVDQCHPGLPVEVLAAFADATFNMGPTIACNRQKSTAARLLYAGDLAGACNQLPRWDKARVMGVMVALPGLTKRRAMERDVCMKGAV